MPYTIILLPEILVGIKFGGWVPNLHHKTLADLCLAVMYVCK